MISNLAIGALVVGGLLMVTQTSAGAAVVDVVARGRRLTSETVAGGVVQESVDDLVAQAAAVLGRDVDADALALALMCRAEEGEAGQITKVALCHVVCNQADTLGWSPLKLVQYHKSGAHFGAQSGGRVASGRDCYENDLAAAELALDQRAAGLDSTGGATNFVNRDAFGVQEGSSTFDDWDAEMRGEGKVGGTLPGTSSALVFYWRKAVPDIAEAI